MEASGVGISSAVICCLCFVSLVVSSPHLCLRFFATLDAYSLLKDLRISVHCFLKFWGRSSENKLRQCAWFPTPGYRARFPRVREVTTLILSLCGDVVLPVSSALLSHHLAWLYSQCHSPPLAPGPARTHCHPVLISLWSPLFWNISTSFHGAGMSAHIRTPSKMFFILANYLCLG